MFFKNRDDLIELNVRQIAVRRSQTVNCMSRRCVRSFIFRVAHFQKELSQLIDVTLIQDADSLEGLDSYLFSRAGRYDRPTILCETELHRKGRGPACAGLCSGRQAADVSAGRRCGGQPVDAPWNSFHGSD